MIVAAQPAFRDELRARGLHHAEIVGGAALQHRRGAVPIPGGTETRQRFRQDRLVERRRCPGLAAVGGDLNAANLLVQDGRLNAVIDFGCLGVGDPACDLMAAWTYLSAETRDVFHAALPADDATWVRGRGWALSFGLIALPYYQSTNPVLAGIARYAINEALADQEERTT